MKISPESVLKIKTEAEIVKVIGHYVSLRKKGANYIGYCPFQLESVPLFIVNPEHQIYKCFGCGQTGDSVKFIMDCFELSYGDALLQLVKKFKIKISEDTYDNLIMTEKQESNIEMDTRTKIAAMAMEGLLSNSDYMTYLRGQKHFLDEYVLAKISVSYADALITELNKR